MTDDIPENQRGGSTVDRVAVGDDPDDGEYHEVTEYNDKRLVVVHAKKVHVWYDGAYYVGTGTAETVDIGDMFYYPKGLSGDGSPRVLEVIDIEQDKQGNDSVVYDVGEVAQESILGEPIQRAQLRPPTLLEKQHNL